MLLLFIALSLIALVLLVRWRKAVVCADALTTESVKHAADAAQRAAQVASLEKEVQALQPWRVVADADAHAKELILSSDPAAEQLRNDAESLRAATAEEGRVVRGRTVDDARTARPLAQAKASTFEAEAAPSWTTPAVRPSRSSWTPERMPPFQPTTPSAGVARCGAAQTPRKQSSHRHGPRYSAVEDARACHRSRMSCCVACRRMRAAVELKALDPDNGAVGTLYRNQKRRRVQRDEPVDLRTLMDWVLARSPGLSPLFVLGASVVRCTGCPTWQRPAVTRQFKA